MIEDLGFTALELNLINVGRDITAVISGGELPHIGTAVLALPRQSLKGNGDISCTSSVLNLSGHKDEALCRAVAEQLCCALNIVVLCTGGVHIDGISTEQISKISAGVDRLIRRATAEYKSSCS